jgi:hypothetical protein
MTFLPKIYIFHFSIKFGFPFQNPRLIQSPFPFKRPSNKRIGERPENVKGKKNWDPNHPISVIFGKGEAEGKGALGIDLKFHLWNNSTIPRRKRPGLPPRTVQPWTVAGWRLAEIGRSAFWIGSLLGRFFYEAHRC